MKAILVVDVEEYGDYYVDVYRKDVGDRFEGRYYLKPMPQKMRTDEDDIEEDSYFAGWNECLEVIEK